MFISWNRAGETAAINWNTSDRRPVRRIKRRLALGRLTVGGCCSGDTMASVGGLVVTALSHGGTEYVCRRSLVVAGLAVKSWMARVRLEYFKSKGGADGRQGLRL